MQKPLISNISAAVAVSIFVVDEQQYDSQNKADGTNSDVRHPQEWILSSHPRNGAQDHSFSAMKAINRII